MIEYWILVIGLLLSPNDCPRVADDFVAAAVGAVATRLVVDQLGGRGAASTWTGAGHFSSSPALGTKEDL